MLIYHLYGNKFANIVLLLRRFGVKQMLSIPRKCIMKEMNKQTDRQIDTGVDFPLLCVYCKLPHIVFIVLFADDINTKLNSMYTW